MAFTKVVGPGIHTLAHLRTHNIHSVGIITATRFVGEIGAGTGNTSTFTNVNVTGNLTVQGDTTTLNTTLRNVELLRVAANTNTTAGIITQTGTGDILNLFDATTEVVTVKDGGFVGIGTVDPQRQLHVLGTTRPLEIGSTNATNIVKLYNSGTGRATYNGVDIMASSTDGAKINAYGGYISLGTTATNGVDAVERLRIDTSGRHLIGDSTSRFYAAKLQVQGASDSNYIMMHNTTPSDASGDRYSKFIFSGTQSGGETSDLAHITAAHDGSADDQKGRLEFRVNTGSSNHSPTEVLRIKSNGDIFMGGLTSKSNESTAILSVEGGNDNIGIINVHAGGGESDGELSGITFSHGGSANTTSRPKAAIALRATGSYGKGDLCFYVDGASDNNGVAAADEKLRIDSSGNVMIGSTGSGGWKFRVQVAANASYQSAVNITNNVNADLNFEIKNSESRFGPSTNTPLVIKNGGGERLRIASDGKIGIGTDNPTDMLDVYSTSDPCIRSRSGSASVGAVVEICGGSDNDSQLILSDGTTAKYNFYRDGSQSDDLRIYDYGGSIDIIRYRHDSYLQLGVTASDEVRIDGSGNVRIMSSTQDSYPGFLANSNAINLTLGSTAGAEPRIYLFGSGNGATTAKGISILTGSGEGNVKINAGLTSVTSAIDGEIFRIQTSYGNAGANQGSALMGFDHFSVSQNPAILIGSEEEGTSSYKGAFVVKVKDAAASDDDPVERLRIKSNGRIGINTTEATSTLQIYGANDGEGTATGQLTLKDNAAYNASPTAGVIFQGHHHSNGAQAIFAGIRGFKANAADGDYDGCLAFDVRTHGAVAYEAMRINEHGDVGINTTSISHVLHTFGTGNTGGVRFENSHTTTTVSGNTASTAFPHNILLSNYQGSGHADNRMTSIGFDIPTTSSHANATIAFQAKNSSGNGDLQFWLENDNTSRERLRITSEGRVGICESSPSSKLHIVSTATTADILRLEAKPVTAATGERSRIVFHVTQSNGQSARLGHIASWSQNNWGGQLAFNFKPANSTPNDTTEEAFRINSSSMAATNGRIVVDSYIQAGGYNNTNESFANVVAMFSARDMAGSSMVSSQTDTISGYARKRSSSDANGTFFFGPYGAFPAGDYTALFRLKISSNSSSSACGYLDIIGNGITTEGRNRSPYTSTARIDLKPTDWTTSNLYQYFAIDFSKSNSAANIECRWLNTTTSSLGVDIYLDHILILPRLSHGVEGVSGMHDYS